MAPPPPPPSSDTTSTPTQPSIQAQRQADYIRFKYGAAITFLIASPVLIAIPPRKLDPYTVLLAGAFCVSANHLVREHTGRSILDRLETRISRPPKIMRSLPSERAEQVHMQLKAAREAAQMPNERRGGQGAGLPRPSDGGGGGMVDEQQQQPIPEGSQVPQQQQQVRNKGIAERIWMGGETEGWKERRLREEQKALDEGKGYGDLIKQHIWEVWNWGQSDQNQTKQEGSASKAGNNEKK